MKLIRNNHIENLFYGLCTSIKNCSLDIWVFKSHFKQLKYNQLLTSRFIKKRLLTYSGNRRNKWLWNLYHGIFLKWAHFCFLIFVEFCIWFRLHDYWITLNWSFQWVFIEANLSTMVIWFLKFIFFKHIPHLVAHYTDFKVFVIFRVIHIVRCMIKIRWVTTWWDSRMLAYLNYMLSTTAHMNRILIRHFNLLNTTSLIDLNSNLISGRLWTLIKHTATACGRFFFNSRHPSSIFNRLFHNARYLYHTCWLQWTLIAVVRFSIWLGISAHVLNPERTPTNLNNKCVFHYLMLLRSRLVGRHYLLLAHLYYSSVSIWLSISTSELIVLNNYYLRTTMGFLIILLSMKKHPWNSWWRSHWLN